MKKVSLDYQPQKKSTGEIIGRCLIFLGIVGALAYIYVRTAH